MEFTTRHHQLHMKIWRQANFRLLPSAALSIAGATMSAMYGNVRNGTLDHKVVALAGVIIFVIFGMTFISILTRTVRHVLVHYRFTPGRSAAIQFMMRIFGYALIFVLTIALLGIPVGNLLLSGAAIGIVLGVAAQQALANFFASIVLIVAHPFSVGDDISFNSGALGGIYTGTVVDIGLTHTKLKNQDEDIVLLPNAAVLSGATITTKKPKK